MSITSTPTLRWYQRPYLIGVLCGVVGIGAGAAVAAAAPTEPETITETVTVSAVPESCITALDAADHTIGSLGDVIESAGRTQKLLSSSVTAAAAFDVATIEANTEGIKAETAILEGIDIRMEDYTSAAIECRTEATK